MRKLKLALPFVIALSVVGCTTADQNNALLGGTAGAVVGGVASGSVEGAAVGAAVGAGAGILIGRVAAGSRDCYYRDHHGNRYIAPCR